METGVVVGTVFRSSPALWVLLSAAGVSVGVARRPAWFLLLREGRLPERSGVESARSQVVWLDKLSESRVTLSSDFTSDL